MEKHSGLLTDTEMNPKLHTAALQHIQQKLQYRFKQPELLTRALTHRSYSSRHNERFEFVGDAILNYAIAKMLYETFPDLPEGRLSRLRANLVNQDTLAEIATELKVGDALVLGNGELKSGGFRRPYPYAFRLQGFHFAILLLWRITIERGDNCHNIRSLLL